MTRNEMADAIASIVSDEVTPTLNLLRDETLVIRDNDAIALWDLIVGARECAIECDAPSHVTDAIDAAELIVRRECERLDINPVS